MFVCLNVSGHVYICWAGLSMHNWYLISSTDDRVPTELKKAIMQARMDKKLTQSQLAQVYHSPSLFPVSPQIYIFHLHIEFLLMSALFFFGQIINEKPQIIQEYESGKAIPNQQIITKLERALGARLRGKK